MYGDFSGSTEVVPDRSNPVNSKNDFFEEAIRRSWQRSIKHGLTESDRLLTNTPSSFEVKQIRELNHRLLSYSEPEMQRLLRSLGSGSWVVSFFGSNGSILNTISGKGDGVSQLTSILRPGTRMSEDIAGTNAAVVALAERRSSVLLGHHHFLRELKRYCCVAGPIVDPRGHLVGAINAAHLNHGHPSNILEPVCLTIRAIENQMLLDLDFAQLIRIHYTPELINSPLCGLIALSSDGMVLGANPLATQLLDISTPLEKTLTTADFFELPHSRVIDGLRKAYGKPIRVQCANGLCLYATLDSKTQTLSRPSISSFSPDFGHSTSSNLVMQTDSRLGKLVRQAERAYAFELPVLINGETGCGKELLARHLHCSAKDRNGPFVAVNCSAIPAGLIEAELFGYESGAFTGARQGGMPGRFEQANGGTLFLDEIGDMPLDLQARLLRVLQERSLTRLGSTKQISLNFGLVCATHRDLKSRLASGEFREDLYYRINGFQLELEPLRVRGDLDDLIDAFLLQESPPTGMSFRLSAQARYALQKYPWPGNIRELRQVIRRGIALAEDNCIDIDCLPPELSKQMSDNQIQVIDAVASDALTLDEAEFEFIRAALARHDGNISATARELKISRATLQRRVKSFR